MGKSHVQHQREYRKHLKKKILKCIWNKIETEKESKEKLWRKLQNMKTTKQKIEWKKEKKKSVTANSTSAMSSPSHSSPLAITSSFSRKQALGKATARATRALPKSPQKKAQILSCLVSQLSPNTKSKVFSSARKKISLELGHPVISAEFKERVIHFLEKPDISYCRPCKSRHCLLW